MPKSIEELKKITEELNSTFSKVLPIDVKFTLDERELKVKASFNKQHNSLVYLIHSNLPLRHELILRNETNSYDLIINDETYSDIKTQVLEEAADRTKKIISQISTPEAFNLNKVNEEIEVDMDSNVNSEEISEDTIQSIDENEITEFSQNDEALEEEMDPLDNNLMYDNTDSPELSDNTLDIIDHNEIEDNPDIEESSEYADVQDNEYTDDSLEKEVEQDEIEEKEIPEEQVENDVAEIDEELKTKSKKSFTKRLEEEKSDTTHLR